MSTDLEAVFKLILNSATNSVLPAEEMPERIIILSDMQFNSCVKFNDTAFKMIQRMYNNAGYKMPQIVFWNINSYDNTPVQFDQRGTALVSGFSPATALGLLGADVSDFTPRAIMLKTIMKDRYAY
jgi:hypothetical protein